MHYCVHGAQWPPLLIPAGAKPAAGPGISAAKLGTFKRADGGLQVTYNGMTLYRYSGDSKAGQANGEAVSDKWYAVSSAGKLVKPAATPSAGGGGLGSTGYTTPSSTDHDHPRVRPRLLRPVVQLRAGAPVRRRPACLNGIR